MGLSCRGASGHSFLVFIYITYKGGGRHTLRMHFDQHDHDWQLAEKTWKPAKPLARATLYIGMGHQSGTAWFDDVYFGPATAGGASPVAQHKETWSREPVTVDFGVDGLIRIDAGAWSTGRTARVVEEGVHEVAFKKTQGDKHPTVRVVRIDRTPPVVELSARPALTQEGGVYGATPETEFVFQADDDLSGVKGVEVSIDGGEFVAHTAPLRLAKGQHEFRCRAADVAGNATKTITGQVLTGGRTDALMVNVR